MNKLVSKLNLKITAKTKVIAGRMLLIAQAKVGPVYFRPT